MKPQRRHLLLLTAYAPTLYTLSAGVVANTVHGDLVTAAGNLIVALLAIRALTLLTRLIPDWTMGIQTRATAFLRCQRCGEYIEAPAGPLSGLLHSVHPHAACRPATLC